MVVPSPRLLASTTVLVDNCLLCFTGTGGGCLVYGGGGVGGGGFFLCLVSAGSFSSFPSTADGGSGVVSLETLTLGTTPSTLSSASAT